MRAHRAATVLLAAVAACLTAWPTAGQSPSPSVAPVSDRPMLAPEGWMFATIQTGDPASEEGRDRLRVVAVSPSGEIRLVGDIPDVAKPVDGEGDPHLAYQWWGYPTGTVTVDGFLPVTVEWSDEAGDDHSAVHVHDLLAADPARPVGVLTSRPGMDIDWSTLRSGSDGRLSVTYDAGGDAPYDARQGVRVLDPLDGSMQIVPPLGREGWWRMVDWLADGSGWLAWEGTTPATMGADGTLRPVAPPLPLVDLSRGAAQSSVTGRALTTFDTGSALPTDGLAFTRECRLWWSQPDWETPRPRVVWWDRCRDTGRVHDIRWDVDGSGVLVLVERDRKVQLVRKDRPDTERVLVSFPAARLAKARANDRRLVVRGLARGPRPGELLLALTAMDHYDSIFFLSTMEQKLIEVRGTLPTDGVDFAGFSVPPIDRDVTRLVPVANRPPAVPAPMVAPDGWMLAARATLPEDPASFDVTVLAVSPTGETRELAVLPGVNRDRLDWSISRAFERGQSVTTTGVLPVVLSPGDPDGGDPVIVRLFDLHAPTWPPIDIADGPGRIHDWTTLRSAPDGTLSVRIDDEGAFNGRHVIAEIDPATGEERLLPYLATIDAVADPLASGRGFPARQDGQAGILRRTDGLFVGNEPRLVSLARGAEQQNPGGQDLGRLVARQRPGDADCETDVVVSGPIDGPVKIWWDVCRDRGTPLDHRWDIDGRGALFLVQRGPRIELLRSDRDGGRVRVAGFPARAVGGREPIDRRVGLTALMEGPRPGELLLAFRTGRGLWFWSTLEKRPVRVPGRGPRTGIWFLGFSVPPGEAR